MAWVTDKVRPLEELQRVSGTARCERLVNQGGHIRYRHWDLYCEQGLAEQRVAVWLSVDAEMLTLEFCEEPLVQYTVKHEPDHERLKKVTPLHIFETRFRSPQLPLWEPGIIDRRLALQRPAPAPRRGRVVGVVQQPLLLEDSNLAANG